MEHGLRKPSVPPSQFPLLWGPAECAERLNLAKMRTESSVFVVVLLGSSWFLSVPLGSKWFFFVLLRSALFLPTLFSESDFRVSFSPFGPFWLHAWTILAPCWHQFGTIWAQCGLMFRIRGPFRPTCAKQMCMLVPFGVHLGPFGKHLGPCWLQLLMFLFGFFSDALFDRFWFVFAPLLASFWMFFRPQSVHSDSHGTLSIPFVKLIIPRILWILFLPKSD